jgi:TPR repeat protein
MLTQYQQEIEEKARQIKAEQDRIEAQQKAQKEADAQKQLDQQQKAAADERKRAEALQRMSDAARQCDQLAANPDDARRVGEGVSYPTLKPQAAEAVDACSLASKQNPNELRFQYQLGRALEQAGDGSVRIKNRQSALEIHQSLVKAGYPAAFDNLGSLYRWDRKDLATAAALFRKGAELGDSDSMLSLADMIENNQVIPQGPNETPLELYKRAAELGNQDGVRAYQTELANAQQMQQQRVQQLQQQQMMLQIMGNVLRNIH